jgi:HAD superfamily hydrolase (TIGR01458 family)
MKTTLLIDLDGVLRVGNKPAPYLNKFLDYLDKNDIKACILSNSSLYSAQNVIEYFSKHSIDINIPIITTVDAAVTYIKGKYKSVAVYTSDYVKNMFMEMLNYNNPEAVLIGDIGNKWNFEIMQQIFIYLKNGASLIAMHKNKYWNKPDVGIQLDAGTFIHGLEYAASVNAEVIGKPSKFYFQSALQLLDLDINSKFLMLGDDLDTDIKGAKQLNSETILIYTRTTTYPYPKEYKNNVDYEAENLLDVMKILAELD